MRVQISVFVLVCSTLDTSSAQAQKKIEPVDLNVPVIVQETPEWCWAASTEMAIKYQLPDSKIRQCEILERGYQLPPGTCCGREMQCVIAARDQSQIKFALQAFGGVYSIWMPPEDPMTLYQQLKARTLVIAQVRTGGGTHAIVLRGMKFPRRIVGYTSDGPVYNTVPIVVVNDPMVGDEPLEMPFAQLYPSWVDSLAVLPTSVAKKPKPAPEPEGGTNDGSSDGAPATPSSSATCTAIQKVVSSLPTMRTITGAFFTKDERYLMYQSRVQMPNPFNICTVTIDTKVDPRTYSYDCAVKSRTKECSEVDAAIRAGLDQVKGCRPDLEFKEENGKSQFDVTFTAISPAGFMIQLGLGGEESCNGSITISKN